MMQLITVGRVICNEREEGLCWVRVWQRTEGRVLTRMKQESHRFHSSSLAQLAY